jgi:hypothetical protein
MPSGPTASIKSVPRSALRCQSSPGIAVGVACLIFLTAGVAAAQTASVQAYGQGCGGRGPAGCYEQFVPGKPNDLAASGMTFMPAAGSYVVVAGASPIVAPSGGPMSFGDDHTRSIPLPFAFPHQGGVSLSLSVCSNGWISPEATTNALYSESVAALLAGPARYCVFWDDLNPVAGGAIYAEADAVGDFHVTWWNVPEYPNTGSNTFQATFRSSGQVEFKWGSMTVVDGLVGYHPGNNGLDPGHSDFSMLQVQPLGDGRWPVTLSEQAGQRPIPGAVFQSQIEHAPQSCSGGVLVFGLQALAWPIDLSSVGLSGCMQYVPADATTMLVTSAGSFGAAIDLRAPGVSNYFGLHIHVQAALFAPTHPGGALTTNALDLLLGH